MKYILQLLLAVVFFSCNRRPPYKTGFEGKPLPSFTLQLIDSTTYINTRDLHFKKPVVFFAVSPVCPYCAAEMNAIIDNMSTLKNTQFYIFTAWPYSTFKDFYARYQLNKYPNIVAGVDLANSFGRYYKIPVVPLTAFYGKDKRLDVVYLGNLSSRQLKQNIKD